MDLLTGTTLEHARLGRRITIFPMPNTHPQGHQKYVQHGREL